MRLSKEQKYIIEKTAIRHFGQQVKVYLFGSRIDSKQKGGDIDLYLESVPEEMATLRNKIAFIVDLKINMGDQKIDVVFKTSTNNKSHFQRIIESNKIPLS
jgi:predicted nucleotidyltransferase